jgi:uridine kinase
MRRQQALNQLADLICTVERPHPLRVAIDGVDASGKTTLADELVPLIENHGRPVIRASVDGFHYPRVVRYQRGADSPEGYYRDSFDDAAILRELLIPLGPGGNGKYCRAVFDFRVDAPAPETRCIAPQSAILLFDGVFLLRPELVDHWDFSIFVDVDFNLSVPRAVARDVARDEEHLDADHIREKYNQRYLPGQIIYLRESQPKTLADVIFDNNDLEDPKVIVNSSCMFC